MSSQIQIVDVLQWIAIVFAAGFIGYFGKYLGKVILDIFHRKASSGRDGDAGTGGTIPARDSSGGDGSAGTFDPGDDQGNGERNGKLMKKQQKAQLKQEKKRVKDTSGK